MFPLAKILLRSLYFRNDRGLFHRPKQWMKRLARLKINRPVLHLQRDVRTEFPIQPRELNESPLRPIRINVVVIDKRPPHHVAAVWRKRAAVWTILPWTIVVAVSAIVAPLIGEWGQSLGI